MNGELSEITRGRRADSNGSTGALRYSPTEADLTMNGSRQAALHEAAAAVARARFGRSVFVRAVVEVSNVCRENCAYCGMRRENRALSRFRAHHDQLAELLIHHLPASVTDINIQAGEDPLTVREVVLPLIRTLRRETPLGISLCLGTLPPMLYGELQVAGAAIYIMKFESADPASYEQIKAPGTFNQRVNHIRTLAASRWKVSSGFIAGLPGESPQHLVRDLHLAENLPLDGCSVSPFIPGEATPFARCPAADVNWALNCMAALRLLRPDWVIPAVSALNLAERDGYRRGLRAGANLVTINLTPGDLREDYVIYKRDRFIMTEERVLAAIAAEGLSPSRQGLVEHYRNGTARPGARVTEPATS